MRKSRLAAFALALTFIALGFYVPLVGILSFGYSQPIAVDAKVWQTVWFTVWQAVVSTTVVVILALPLAYLLYRKNFKGQAVVRALITVPFILPILVIAISFSTFQKSNVLISPVALIIAAHVFVNLGLAVRVIGSAWQAISPSLDEAAALDGAGRLRNFCSVTFGLLRPSITASATLVFAYTSASFAVVLVLGAGLVQSIETAIYQAALSYLDLGKAAVYALLQLLLMGLSFWLSEVFAKHARLDFSDIELSDVDARKRLDLRDAPAIAVGIAIGFSFVLPIWNVFSKAFTFGDTFSMQNFVNLLAPNAASALDSSIAQAAGNSLRNVAIASLSSLLIGCAVAWMLAHSKRNLLSRLTDFAYLAPIGVSTVLLGLGYLVTYSSEPFALRSSWLVVPLVETLLALPLMVRMVYSALKSVDSSVLDAAAVDGANQWQVARQIELPLIRPTLEVAAGFAAIIALGDFGASSFLAFGDQETLPLVLFRLFSHPGANNYGMAMALSSLLIVLTCVLLIALAVRSRSKKH